ncbi:MAG TPA: tyrosine-type recombinase/integrase [Opitutaceae bacterium]
MHGPHPQSTTDSDPFVLPVCSSGSARTRRTRAASPRDSFKAACKKVVGFLTRAEIEGMLSVVDRSSWVGQRDYALLLTMMQTGLRLAEATGLTDADVHLGTGPHLRCNGKGRKERCTPLTKSSASVLRSWMAGRGNNISRLFPALRGDRLSHDAVQDLVTKYAAAAVAICPSLPGRRVTPHMLRHTAAMELLQAGIDRSLIAIWLGHESVETTQVYLDANLALKEKILERMNPTQGVARRFRPSDRLLAYLQSL